MAVIRVLIADDHPLLRKGLREAVEAQRDMQVCGEAARADDVLPLAARGCDVLVLDLMMPGRGGLDVLADLKAQHPHLPVIILTAASPEQFAQRALRAGAAGFLTKESAPTELVTAIRKVSEGGRYLSHAVAEQVAWQAQEPAAAVHHTLSDRELEVMRRLAGGEGISEIAAHLALSPKTVSTYRARVLEKLNLHNNAELVKYALQHRLLE